MAWDVGSMQPAVSRIEQRCWLPTVNCNRFNRFGKDHCLRGREHCGLFGRKRMWQDVSLLSGEVVYGFPQKSLVSEAFN